MNCKYTATDKTTKTIHPKYLSREASTATFAIDIDDKVYAWGLSSIVKAAADLLKPTSLSTILSNNLGSLAGKTVTEVITGYQSSVALASDKTLHVWGDSTSGQLGQGNTNSQPNPVQFNLGAIAGKNVITATGSKGSFTIAVDDQGLAYSAFVVFFFSPFFSFHALLIYFFIFFFAFSIFKVV